MILFHFAEFNAIFIHIVTFTQYWSFSIAPLLTVLNALTVNLSLRTPNYLLEWFPPFSAIGSSPRNSFLLNNLRMMLKRHLYKQGSWFI